MQSGRVEVKMDAKKGGEGMPREVLQGSVKDPSGTDTEATAANTGNDQQQSKGGEGLEGGSAGKFTRPFREGGESGRSQRPQDRPGRDTDGPPSNKA